MNKFNYPNPLSFIRKIFVISSFLAFQAFFVACETEQPSDNDNTSSTEQPVSGDDAGTDAPAADDGKGVGPIKTIDVGAGIDASMAEKGKAVFDAKCTACHNVSADKKVGPGLAGITERRKPEWIMNMILNPEKMVQEDPAAKELLAEYIAPMANQNLTEEEARQVLEYFRQNDQKK